MSCSRMHSQAAQDLKEGWLSELLARRIEPTQELHSRMLSDKDTNFKPIISKATQQPIISKIMKILIGRGVKGACPRASSINTELVGSWTVQVGDMDQILHLWRHKGGFAGIHKANRVLTSQNKSRRNGPIRKQVKIELDPEFSDISSTSSDSYTPEPSYNFDKWLTLAKEEEIRRREKNSLLKTHEFLSSNMCSSASKLNEEIEGVDTVERNLGISSNNFVVSSETPLPGFSGRQDSFSARSSEISSSLSSTLSDISFHYNEPPLPGFSGGQDCFSVGSSEMSSSTLSSTSSEISFHSYTPRSPGFSRRQDSFILENPEREPDTQPDISIFALFGSHSPPSPGLSESQDRVALESPEREPGTQPNNSSYSLFRSNTPPSPGFSGRQEDQVTLKIPKRKPNNLTYSLFRSNTTPSPGFSGRHDRSSVENPELSSGSQSDNSCDPSFRSDTSLYESSEIQDVTFRNTKLLSYTTPLPRLVGPYWNRNYF